MSMKLSQSSTYRPDIDGLRCVAVATVVIFHAFPEALPGGFVGVDIFFVISGYLISGNIFSRIDASMFSFLEFYEHRIRRILPALAVVLAAVMTAGWFILLGDEYAQLGKHATGAAIFASNFLLWHESGYFDNASATKPLLHLWSLGIEEQFYIVWPPILLAARKLRLNWWLVLVTIFLASFAANIHYRGIDPVADFYSPATRFWELTIGAVLALAERDFKWMAVFRRLWVGVFGIAIIAISVFYIHEGMPFPGWLAIGPTLGSALLIASATPLLANRLFVGIGLISYPLYLWHWPLLSLARIVGSETPSTGIRISVVVLSVALAWLTYRSIERPIRFGPRERENVWALTSALTVIGIVGFIASRDNGFEGRHVVSLNPLARSGAADRDELDKVHIAQGCGVSPEAGKLLALCFHDPRGTARYALIGDSKAGALWKGVFGETRQPGYWVFLGSNGPHGANVPVISDASEYEPYQALIRPTIEALETNRDIKVVVFTTAMRALFQLKNSTSIDDLPASKNFDIAFSGLNEAASRLIKAGKKVVLTIDNPALNDPKECLSRVTAIPFLRRVLKASRVDGCSISYDRFLELSAQYRLLLEKLKRKHPEDLLIFDPLDLLCDMKARLCSSSLDGRLLYDDSDHISQYSSFRIARKLVPFVESLDGGAP
ncbi:acyltransferase family protein [Bradyrhizobium tropiciagri]|uniref:acyltransferase family protein n=1 Tax=Bradyrhizobium tropiciagri TaxID=312253 RepID=UPI00067BC5CA|nr:acyltransferase family protein [Bradyrhizobium tropiciagri]